MSQEWVIDPSVLIQGYIEDSQTPRVHTLLSMVSNPSVALLHTVEFCLLECTNILWNQVRFHGTLPDLAQQALANLVALPLTLHSGGGLLPRALAIGLDYRLAIYDSLYIALAEEAKLPLLTVDSRQAYAANALNVSTKPITDFAEFIE